MKIVNPIAIIGENAAVDFLKKKGYLIIERNFRKRYGEIDIIAIKDNVLVFIEVKTRKSKQFGTPLEAITYWKLRELKRMAEYYSLTHPKLPKALRIDGVGVLLDKDNEVAAIEHVENISGY
jgi:putative endonuclease